MGRVVIGSSCTGSHACSVDDLLSCRASSTNHVLECGAPGALVRRAGGAAFEAVSGVFGVETVGGSDAGVSFDVYELSSNAAFTSWLVSPETIGQAVIIRLSTFSIKRTLSRRTLIHTNQIIRQ